VTRLLLRRELSRQKKQADVIIAVLLILTLFANTGLSYQLFGQPRAVLLNSHGQQYDTWYIHPQEIAAGTWLWTNERPKTHIYVDSYGAPRLKIAWSLVPVTLQGSPDQSIFPIFEVLKTPRYTYARYENVVDGTVTLSGQTVTSTSALYSPVANTSLESGNRIYSNGGSDIYLSP
jgi:uncharacterized membrane protein